MREVTQSADQLLVSLVHRRDAANLQAPFDIDRIELAGESLRAMGRVENSVRVGGMVPGPVQMAMADCFGWMLSVAPMPPGSDAFTVELSMQFLCPLPIGAYVAECERLRWSAHRSVVTMRIAAAPGQPASSNATLTFAPRSAQRRAPSGPEDRSATPN
jgi:acyl-coenzyme A thioesterase PaaI-like protein